jgi:hypothetical protein
MLIINAARSRHLAALLLVLGASALAACAPKATKEECEKLGDHVVEVLLRGYDAEGAKLAKPLMDKVRVKEIDACVGKMAASEVKCAMEGKTGAEIDKCTSSK